MHNQAGLLAGVIKGAPHGVFFGHKQAANQRANFSVPCRHLLQIRVAVAKAPGDCSCVVASQLVQFSVNSTIVVMFEDGVYEGRSELCVRGFLARTW